MNLPRLPTRVLEIQPTAAVCIVHIDRARAKECRLDVVRAERWRWLVNMRGKCVRRLAFGSLDEGVS